MNRLHPTIAWAIAIQFALSLGLMGVVLWWQRSPGWGSPRFAVVDVPQLYRLKEAQVAAVLVDKSLSDTQRQAAIQGVARFGQEVAQLIEGLPGHCSCLVFTRGAVTGDAANLIDLTPTARERLGL